MLRRSKPLVAKVSASSAAAAGLPPSFLRRPVEDGRGRRSREDGDFADGSLCGPCHFFFFMQRFFL